MSKLRRYQARNSVFMKGVESLISGSKYLGVGLGAVAAVAYADVDIHKHGENFKTTIYQTVETSTKFLGDLSKDYSDFFSKTLDQAVSKGENLLGDLKNEFDLLKEMSSKGDLSELEWNELLEQLTHLDMQFSDRLGEIKESAPDFELVLRQIESAVVEEDQQELVESIDIMQGVLDGEPVLRLDRKA